MEHESKYEPQPIEESVKENVVLFSKACPHCGDDDCDEYDCPVLYMRIQLQNRLVKRQSIFKQYQGFIEGMICGKQNGIRFRKVLHRLFHYLSTHRFPNEEDEYLVVGKFGTGMWEEDMLRKSFNKEEMKIIVEIANGFGAFDY
jgi:hypothetical protein